MQRNLLGRSEFARAAARDCLRSGSRDFFPTRVSSRSWARLSHTQSRKRNALGRGSAAHSARDANWLRTRGVLYVLDEPSIGLHQRDNARLIGTLRRLRDLGNSVIVVEHDEETIRAADYILDLGPGAGPRGGEIVAAGTLAEILEAKNSPTAAYLVRAIEDRHPAPAGCAPREQSFIRRLAQYSWRDRE